MRPFQPNHLYAQVRDELAKRIATEVYPAGSVLPNEFLLAGEMQVSVGTIRRAVEMLCDERLVIRSQGRGTVVSDRQSADYRSKFDRVRNVDGSAISWTFRELSQQTRSATDEEIRALNLQSGADVVTLRRVRETLGKRVKREYVRLPADLFADISDFPIAETTIENLAFVKGLHISSSEERLTLMSAPEEIARDLGIASGTVVLRLERFIHDGNNRPIEWRLAHCHLDGRVYDVPSPMGSRDSKVSPQSVLDPKSSFKKAAAPPDASARAFEEM